jgi:hypothetical protein
MEFHQQPQSRQTHLINTLRLPNTAAEWTKIRTRLIPIEFDEQASIIYLGELMYVSIYCPDVVPSTDSAQWSRHRHPGIHAPSADTDIHCHGVPSTALESSN